MDVSIVCMLALHFDTDIKSCVGGGSLTSVWIAFLLFSGGLWLKKGFVKGRVCGEIGAVATLLGQIWWKDGRLISRTCLHCLLWLYCICLVRLRKIQVPSQDVPWFIALYKCNRDLCSAGQWLLLLSWNPEKKMQNEPLFHPKVNWCSMQYFKKKQTTTNKKTTSQPKPKTISQIKIENIFAKVLLHLAHPLTFTVTEHLLKSCIFNVYFNTFWLASLYRIAPWQECVYVCAPDLMLFFLVISKGVW